MSFSLRSGLSLPTHSPDWVPCSHNTLRTPVTILVLFWGKKKKMRTETHRETAVTFQGADRVEGGQRVRQERPLLPRLFNIVLEVLARAIR